MPAMLRTSKKSQKLAEELLGLPQNMRKKKKKRKRKIDEEISYQNTVRMRQ
jgi:hypothetical protein